MAQDSSQLKFLDYFRTDSRRKALRTSKVSIQIFIPVLAGAVSAAHVGLTPRLGTGLLPYFTWATILLPIGLIVISLLDDKLESLEKIRLEVKAADFHIAINETIIPIIREIQAYVHLPTEHKERSFNRILNFALHSYPWLFPGVKGIRMVIYRAIELDAGTRQLSPIMNHGRQRNKPKAFTSGDNGRGDAVFEWLNLGEPKFVGDIKKELNPNWKGSGRGYTTFISIPIVYKDTGYGMLTVDAPNPGDLDEVDIPKLEAIAELLGIVFISEK